MKILIVNYEFPPLGGGASPVSYEIAKGYVKQGHAVDVVTMHYKGLPEFEVVDGINVYRVKSIRAKKEICQTHEMLSFVMNGFSFFRKHMKTHKYDVNHTHFIIPSAILSMWLKRKYGLNYVITPHGSDVPGYNEDRFTFAHNFTKPLLKRIVRKSAKIISPSNYLANLILKNIDPNLDIKLMKIPNGIDPGIFTPQKKEKIILTTGRLLPRKGVQHLIKALSDKDIGYEIHVCGDGPIRNELEELAKSSKTKVVFHGWIDNKGEKYKRLLETASIYSLVSAKENASVSLLEAMSAGCGVLTSDVSGCPETVEEAGVIVKPRDVDAIRESIYKFVEDQNFLNEKMQLARQKIMNQYDWKKLVSNYIKELEQAAK